MCIRDRTKTPHLARGEVVSTSPASEQVFVVTAGRRAGYLLESFELAWGPAGLAATAVSAASAVDHRLDKSRSVQPDSDIIASDLSKNIVSVVHAESDERFARSVTVHCPCANTLDSSVLEYKYRGRRSPEELFAAEELAPGKTASSFFRESVVVLFIFVP